MNREKIAAFIRDWRSILAGVAAGLIFMWYGVTFAAEVVENAQKVPTIEEIVKQQQKIIDEQRIRAEEREKAQQRYFDTIINSLNEIKQERVQ